MQRPIRATRSKNVEWSENCFSPAPVDHRRERVVVETDRYRVEGEITLPAEGFRSRLSDHVNRRDQEFFTVVDAELTALDGSGRNWRAPVLMLARRHVRLLVPAGEQPE